MPAGWCVSGDLFGRDRNPYQKCSITLTQSPPPMPLPWGCRFQPMNSADHSNLGESHQLKSLHGSHCLGPEVLAFLSDRAGSFQTSLYLLFVSLFVLTEKGMKTVPPSLTCRIPHCTRKWGVDNQDRGLCPSPVSLFLPAFLVFPVPTYLRTFLLATPPQLNPICPSHPLSEPCRPQPKMAVPLSVVKFLPDSFVFFPWSPSASVTFCLLSLSDRLQTPSGHLLRVFCLQWRCLVNTGEQRPGSVQQRAQQPCGCQHCIV